VSRSAEVCGGPTLNNRRRRAVVRYARLAPNLRGDINRNIAEDVGGKMPAPPIAGAAIVAIGLALGVTACSGSTEQPGGTSAPADAPSSTIPVVGAPPSSTPTVSPEDLDASTYEHSLPASSLSS
jgi:hypothetical protein